MEPIDQHEFEAAVYKILEYGDETKLARMAGKAPGYYSQMLNPEDPRESLFYRAARDLYNLVELDEERGLKLLDLFCHFVNRARIEKKDVSPDETRARVYRENMEATLADASDVDIDTKIQEWEQLYAAIPAHIGALRAKRTRAKAASVIEMNGRAKNGTGRS